MTDKPASSSKAPSRGRGVSRTYAGLPELALFPDEESRKLAVKQIERAVIPRTWKQGFQLLFNVLLAMAGPAVLAYIITTHIMPSMGKWNSRVATVIILGGYTIAITLMLRRDMPRSLRQKLLEIGVPVCIARGYDLRGSTANAERCPECGKGIDPRAASALSLR